VILLQHITEETSNYAQQQIGKSAAPFTVCERVGKWKDITVDEEL
jgi:hypothetical protein